MFKISKLFNAEDIMARIKLFGVGVLSEMNNRCSGRTLGLAYYYIGKAMITPYTPVYIEDHYPKEVNNAHLFSLITKIIGTEGLEHFVLNKADLTITYDIFY